MADLEPEPAKKPGSRLSNWITASGAGGSVEVMFWRDRARLRDTADKTHIVDVPKSAWLDFIGGVKDGVFDWPGE